MYAHGAFLSTTVLLAHAAGAAATGVWATPHDKYSSSIGVLGCKINTNRVAYWPGSVDCNNICVKLSYQGRSVHLLRIDQSGGAYDISYDAWNYLQTGKSATDDPITGGTVAMDYEEVDASECADLIYTDGHKLPLSAANSMNFLTSCLSQPSSWIAKNYVLYNICDAICSLGNDETCTLDLATSNQPSCPHTLGLTSPLTSAPVYDIQYQSGKMVVAGSGAAAPAGTKVTETDDSTANSPASSSASSANTGGVFLEVSSSTAAAPTSAAATTSAAAAPTTTSSPAAAAVAATTSTSAAGEPAAETTTQAAPTATLVTGATTSPSVTPGNSAAGASAPPALPIRRPTPAVTTAWPLPPVQRRHGMPGPR
ncbi:hypothetical protein GQ53DRAFT_781651 [Thozetella sp. PMI_491]|nr:hypothetical protein GQ53DRAFT_781651 [Thozetella sp. PMI_491]